MTRSTRAASVLLMLSLSGCTKGAGAGAVGASESASESASTSASTSTSQSGSASASPSAVTSTHEKLPGRVVFRRYSDAAGTSGSLFTRALDGSDERPLTQPLPKTLDQPVRWSPDGKRVLFTRVTQSSDGNDVRRLWTVAADGSDLRPLTAATPEKNGTPAPYEGDGSYSPDSTRIAYMHATRLYGSYALPHSDVYVMDASGRNRHPVTHLPTGIGEVSGVRWSPDGKRLLFSYATNETGTPPNGHALFTVGVDGSGLAQLTPWKLSVTGIADWSAATNLIVIRVTPDEETGVGNFYTIHPDGTGLTPVTKFTDTVISHQVGFSPDGQWIVFSAQPKDAAAANGQYVAKVDGTDTFPVSHPAYAESCFDWTK
ncbi:MAG: TolB protein [Frankiaceae bacterium]|nr:TolB protein [Frankiaceae bacterium]